MTRHDAPRPPTDPADAAATDPVPRPPHDAGEMWADDGTSRAEIDVGSERLQVTLPVPDVAPGALEHYVGSNVLILWSADAPETQRTLVHLPEDVRPETSVARVTNGVFDLVVLRADAPDDASPPDQETSPATDGSA